LHTFLKQKRLLETVLGKEKRKKISENALKSSFNDIEVASFGRLPVEIITHIFHYLTPFELSHAVSRVNRRFCEIALSDQLWRRLFKLRWNHERDTGKLNKDFTWQQTYKSKYRTEMNWKHGQCVQKMLSGHNAGVWCLKMHDHKMVSGSADCTVKIWNINKRFRNVKTLRGHAGVVKCIDYDPENGRVASGSCDGIIRIWDIHKTKKKCATVLEGHNNWVRGLQMCGNVLVSASSDRTLRAWNITTKQCVSAYDGHSNYVRCLQFTGDRMISGSADNTIRVWDMNTSQCTQVLRGHSSVIRALQFEGNRVVSASADCTLGIWDLNSEKCVTSLYGHTLPLWCMNFEGNRLVSGSGDRTLKVWDLRKYQCTNTLVGHSLPVWSVAIEGSTIVSGSADRLIKVWSFG
jgi:WD40 repeat protein